VDGLFGFNLRVPVSAALLFLMAGAFGGVTRSPKETPDPLRLPTGAVAWRLTVIALSLTLAIMSSRLFASEQAMYHGRTAMAQRAFDRAEDCFAKGEALCPSNWIFAHERARASMRGGHAEQAAIHFHRALDKNPHYIVTLIGLARTKMNLALAVPPHEAARQAQLLEEAQEFAEQARTLCPIMSEADDILGSTASVRAVGFQKQAQADATLRETLAALWQEAETRLTGALAKKTDNRCQLLCMLAQARIGLGDPPGAEQAFVDAIHATPSSKDAWAAFARFTRAAKRPHAFQELARNAIDTELTSDTPDEGLIAALALHAAQLEQSTFQDPETIESAYALAVRYAPAQPEIWSAFALFSKKTRRSEAFKEAALTTHRALRAKGIRPIPALSAASQAWEEGGPALASATGDLVRAIKAHPAQKDVNTLRLEFGWAAEVLLAEIERAGATLENRGVALLNLGTILMNLGNPKLADMVLAVALPALPKSQKPLCMQYRAEVLSHLNRHAEAALLLRSLLDTHPGDLNTRLALARALARSGKAHEARTHYEALLASPTLSPKARPTIEKELRALGGQ
jgi:tetratricopeptide (TPR) repeat protein